MQLTIAARERQEETARAQVDGRRHGSPRDDAPLGARASPSLHQKVSDILLEARLGMADVLTAVHDFARVYQSGNAATILFHG